MKYDKVKADMSKAYDRVEWGFLKAIMEKMGFYGRWVQLIIKCVTSMRYQIKVNGSYIKQFWPSRGLMQGDPLSPYFFVIYAGGLLALIHDAKRRGRFIGIKVCAATPSITHLFSADDSMLLMKAEMKEAFELFGILSLYENCLGQCINFKKSVIVFSRK